MVEETKTCPYCGSDIPINVKKCKYCGEWLVIQDKDKPKSCLHIGGAIEAIICAILVICIFTIDYNDGVMFLLLCLYVGLHIYFLPSIIADKKRTQYTAAIFAINFFLGITVIGWVGSLVWALSLPNLSKNIEHRNGNVNAKSFVQEKSEAKAIHKNIGIITNASENELPSNIKKWNWGAFWLSWLWGIGNKSVEALWALIPYFGFVWMFVCGAKGNEWAWKNKQWSSIEEYNNIQKKWAVVGNCIAAFVLILALIFFVVVQKVSKEPISKKQISVQEKVNSNIEEHDDVIDMSEDDYNRIVRESERQKQNSELLQRSALNKS